MNANTKHGDNDELEKINNRSTANAAKIIFGSATSCHAAALNAIVVKIKRECANDSVRTAKVLLDLQCPLARAISLRDPAITRYMLKSGRNVDEKDTARPHFTPLQQAIVSSDSANVEVLVDHGCDVDAAVHWSETNVEDLHEHWPILPIDDTKNVDENFAILKILLANEAPLTSRFVDMLLKAAFLRGTREMVNALIRSNLKFVSEYHKWNLLFLLADNANFDVDELIPDLMSIVDCGKRAATVAMCSAVKARNAKTLKLMLKMGVDVDGAPLLFCAFERCEADTRNGAKCVKLLLDHDVDVQRVHENRTIFHYFRDWNSRNYEAMKFILARLALMEATGREITDAVSTKIDADAMFKKYLEICRRKVEKMKRTIVFEELTQFEFVTAVKKIEVIKFARNKSLLARLMSMVNYKRRSRFYCHAMLRERARKAVEIANLRESAFHAVAQIRYLRGNVDVIWEIADYYVHDELKRVALA